MSSRIRWLLVGIVVVVSVHIGLTQFGWLNYIQNWGAVQFKFLHGACLGWIFFRGVIGVDISKLPAEQRPLAGLSLAILAGLGGHAMATGA